MILRTAAFALLLIIAPTVAAGNQQLTAYSDATYPQEWRILHDYWFNATSFLEDSRTFHVRMSIPAAGDYVWILPEKGGVEPDLPNPLAGLFSSLRIGREANATIWDLAKTNTTSPFHADGVHDVLFTFTYRIKNLSPYEYTSLLDETRHVRDAERRQWPDGNIVSRPNEASGFLRLQQVSSDSQPNACEATCAGFTNLMGRDFNLVFNLRGHAFQQLGTVMAHILPLLVPLADELVALLRQFTRLERLPVQDALLLLRPMEEAAAANIAGDIDAYAAVLHAVRDRYVPAILAAHAGHGVPVARILDGIAQTIGAGRVVADAGRLSFQPLPRCQPALADFMAGLLEETSWEIRQRQFNRTAA